MEIWNDGKGWDTMCVLVFFVIFVWYTVPKCARNRPQNTIGERKHESKGGIGNKILDMTCISGKEITKETMSWNKMPLDL